MGSLVVVDKLSVTAGSATLVDALSFTIRCGRTTSPCPPCPATNSAP